MELYLVVVSQAFLVVFAVVSLVVSVVVPVVVSPVVSLVVGQVLVVSLVVSVDDLLIARLEAPCHSSPSFLHLKVLRKLLAALGTPLWIHLFYQGAASRIASYTET